MPIGLIASSLFVACSNDDSLLNDGNDDAVIQRIDVTLQEKETIAYYNDFAWRLYNLIITDNPQENKVVSPLSVSMAIGMLANGASVEAQDEIMDVLGLERQGISQLNSVNSKLALGLRQVDSNVKLSLANSFWYNSMALHPYDSFAKVLAECYDAETVGFEGAPATQINSWVEKRTGGLIKDMLSQGSNSDVYLINATYFKGKWASNHKFDPKNTVKDEFNGLDGSKSYGDFMQNTDYYLYKETESAHCFSLAMGSDDRSGQETFRFNIILPKTNSSVQGSIQEMISQGEPIKHYAGIILHMPKFEAVFKGDILSYLEQIGLVKTFEDSYEGIASQQVGFDSVLHGANIKVNEDGAEAAAGTVIQGDTSAGPSAEPDKIEIRLDEPFIYYITEQSTGAILFIGHIAHL